ncbi:MAG: hypothetical protein OXM58_13420 [Rhodospirillaceae bacterium]|nr:hypothetical protein [Rhodospirillaceae bacterium]
MTETDQSPMRPGRRAHGAPDALAYVLKSHVTAWFLDANIRASSDPTSPLSLDWCASGVKVC